MASPYKRPPITEAVIEVRIEEPVGRDGLDKLQKRLLVDYPLSQETQSFGVEISSASARVQPQFQGYRLSDTEGVETVLLSPLSIGTARLPPYEG